MGMFRVFLGDKNRDFKYYSNCTCLVLTFLLKKWCNQQDTRFRWDVYHNSTCYGL